MTDQAQTLAARGRAARSRRALIRQDIASGALSVPELLEGRVADDVEAEALNMTVAVLVGAVPSLGPDAVDRILTGRRVGPTRRLGELTTRARHDIAAALRKETDA